MRIIFFIFILLFSCAPKVEKEEIPKYEPKIEEDIKKIVANYLIEAERAIKEKDYKEATEILRKAKELSPKNPDVYFLMGRLYEELGEDKESVRCYVEALKLDPNIKDRYR